jgi:hypothetical protein
MTSDRRHAKRHPERLDVDLHQRTTRRRLHAVDVSRHGMFLACPAPPPLHHAVLLTVLLPGGPFETMATIVRRNEHAELGPVGAGIKLFCLGAEAKSRWDRFVASLEGVELVLPTRPSNHAACFLVQLETPAALFEFFQAAVLGKKTLHVSPALRELGAEVLFVLVHPASHDELELVARVVEYNPDRPLRMGVRFENIDRSTRAAFVRFLGPLPGAEMSVPDGVPLLGAERPRWTEYAFYAPRLGAAPEPAPVEVPSAGDPEVADLDIIEGRLLELPELELVDKRELFDFDWTNEHSPARPEREEPE